MSLFHCQPVALSYLLNILLSTLSWCRGVQVSRKYFFVCADLLYVVRLHRSYMCGRRQGGGKEKMLSMLKEEVEEMEEDLKRQTQMNDISLTSCTTKTLQSSKSAI